MLEKSQRLTQTFPVINVHKYISNNKASQYKITIVACFLLLFCTLKFAYNHFINTVSLKIKSD